MSQITAPAVFTASDINVVTTAPQAKTPSRAAVWTGRVLGFLPAAFLLFDAGLKFARPSFVTEGTLAVGFPVSTILPLGVVLLVSTLLYLVPRTAVLGAILLTGYLGGAVATHVRLGHPLFSNVLFPVYFGVMLWLGLYLRYPRIRALLPVCSTRP